MGLRASIRAATALHPLRSSRGANLGHTHVLKVEKARIIRTSDRMIRGMFPKLLGAVLPKEYEATALLLDLQKDDSALLDPDVQALLERLVSDGIHKTYGDVLDVYALHDDDDRYCSMWLVRLHGAFVFVGFTAPRNA